MALSFPSIRYKCHFFLNHSSISIVGICGKSSDTFTSSLYRQPLWAESFETIRGHVSQQVPRKAHRTAPGIHFYRSLTNERQIQEPVCVVEVLAEHELGGTFGS